jgi:hypothetical protein
MALQDRGPIFQSRALYERWFIQPISPRQTALNLPISYLLREFWK